MPTLWQPVYMIKGFFGTHKICSMPNKTNNIYTEKKKNKNKNKKNKKKKKKRKRSHKGNPRFPSYTIKPFIYI